MFNEGFFSFTLFFSERAFSFTEVDPPFGGAD